MKARKIFITSIIINILTIGVIYNFIKKDYLNNEKIIVKAMTETEYENSIKSLNQSHADYANFIQESKAKIASAITDMGVSTSNEATPETMANNIKSIARDASSIRYDNSSTTLTSTDVQGAVGELNDSLTGLGKVISLATFTTGELETVTLPVPLTDFRYIMLSIIPSRTNNQILASNCVPRALFYEHPTIQADYANQYNVHCSKVSDTVVKGKVKEKDMIGVLYGIK